MGYRSATKSIRDEDGGATVEFVIWVPIFLLIAGLVVDVSTLMTQHARFYDVARDASRQVALGLLTTAQAEQGARDQLGSGYTVNIVEDATYATTTISTPVQDVVLFGKAFPFGGNLTARVSMYREAAVGGGTAFNGGS